MTIQIPEHFILSDKNVESFNQSLEEKVSQGWLIFSNLSTSSCVVNGRIITTYTIILFKNKTIQQPLSENYA